MPDTQTDRQTTEDRATQLLYSIQFKLSHAIPCQFCLALNAHTECITHPDHNQMKLVCLFWGYVAYNTSEQQIVPLIEWGSKIELPKASDEDFNQRNQIM